MSEQKVQTNPYHLALVNSQEAYLGEILGKYLDTDAKLRMAYAQINELQEKTALFEQQAGQLNEAQEALKAAISNKEAFEGQNTSLMDDVNALKRQLQDVKRDRQSLQEDNMKLKEKLERAAKRKTATPRRRGVKSNEAVDGKQDTTKTV